jgi:hypothetical protein
MANEARARSAPEREVTVDLSQADPAKAIERRAPSIASQVRDDDDRGNQRGAPKRSKTEEELFKRMTRMQKSLTRQFDQKLADQQATHQRELADLRTKYETGVEVERGSTQLKDAHEKAMAELEKQLAEANEKGDSAAIARLTTAMIKADGEYHARLTGTKVRPDVTGKEPNNGGQQQQRQQQAKGPTPAGSRFILANEGWWEDPEFAVEKQAASTIFLDLVQNEGFADNSEETFKEVAKRLKAKFVHLDVVAPGGKKVRTDEGPGDGDDDEGDEEAGQGGDDRGQSQQRRAAAASITDRGNGGRFDNRNRRTLTAEELKTMRSVGLSPDNDKDVIQFLREIVSMEQSA